MMPTTLEENTTTLEKERLISLIEFAQQTARMTKKVVSQIDQHALFKLYEDDLRGLPGITLNINSAETEASESDIWMSIARLHERKAPEIEDAILAPWIEFPNNLTNKPKLKSEIAAKDLPKGSKESSKKTISLESYENKNIVKASFKKFVGEYWKGWVEEEKERRKTIKLYNQLFTLQQQVQEAALDAPLEVVWGLGIGIWNTTSSIQYPLLTQLCELSLNPKNAAIEVRPRDLDAQLELDGYTAVDNSGLSNFEKSAKDFFTTSNQTLSPFDKNTYEPLLKMASTLLDSNGVYTPKPLQTEEAQQVQITLPKADTKLNVVDTWVLFARPRTNNIYLQDLENFKKKLESTKEPVIPGAVAQVVKDPSNKHSDDTLPAYRGLSTIDGVQAPNTKVQDLFFPMPFNDEQVRIVQMLDASDGVVVQGPPGTGKTHSIANVISHYLANGKRVLVTSMKDPALSVLQEKLPPEIQTLAISLLTSEADGMKQFEKAISKIASEVQNINRASLSIEIKQCEEEIDLLHLDLISIDAKTSEWAKNNLSSFTFEGQRFLTQDAAKEVLAYQDAIKIIPDAITIEDKHNPKFTDAQILQLREARKALAKDMEYVEDNLPKISDFPEAKLLVQAHADLSRFEHLSKSIEQGDIPPLRDTKPQTFALAQDLEKDVITYRDLKQRIQAHGKTWSDIIVDNSKTVVSKDVQNLFTQLGSELKEAVDKRETFLSRPITAPVNFDQDSTLFTAIQKLSKNKSPFGLFGLFGNSETKKKLDSIRILSNKPSSKEDWKYVLDFFLLQKNFRELVLRWNNLAPEFGMESISKLDQEGAVRAYDLYNIFESLYVTNELESTIVEQSILLLPDWPQICNLKSNLSLAEDLEKILQQHLTRSRLEMLGAIKAHFNSALKNKSGKLIESIRHFFNEEFGNTRYTDKEIQNNWAAHLNELTRLQELAQHFTTVNQITQLIEKSGAPKYAASLRQVFKGKADITLPENLTKLWRAKRIFTHLRSIDAQDELKSLAEKRQNIEASLAKAYQEAVSKRTWLKLAENATPSIRSALMAYLNAIQKIGKGTGKRAIRYRQDARFAAAQANAAVPCWIMPHYRVYESLPAQLGCFDLVIIDEASQSDLSALPALLRAKKVLIVGDDKQVSPEGVGLEEEKIKALMSRYLSDQVPNYAPQMSPERSIYDLFKVVFAKSSIMLKEHFRCVGSIIEYSKREFYNHELRPLRVPKSSEKLDPPLIDIFIQDGVRKGDINESEAQFIVNEIEKIVSDPQHENRSIGVVSLLASKQANLIWEMLTDKIGPELIARHKIACGDARAFQGKERDIMFLSMVISPKEKLMPLSREAFAQRFNVAASRARDRMYLVRSIEPSQLSEADQLRKHLIAHFDNPFGQKEERVATLRELCESPFETDLYDLLREQGYWVTPKVKVGEYRIDLVVEGKGDNRLAIECDGDSHHTPDRWEADMRRQRILERAGWTFWRCFASSFMLRKEELLQDLIQTLAQKGIEPMGTKNIPRSVYSEKRKLKGIVLDSRS